MMGIEMTKARIYVIVLIVVGVVSIAASTQFVNNEPSIKEKVFTENDSYMALGLENHTIEEGQKTILSIYLLDDQIKNHFDNIRAIGYNFQKSDYVKFINGSKKRSYYEENIDEYRQKITAELPPGTQRATFELTVTMTYENLSMEMDTIKLEVV